MQKRCPACRQFKPLDAFHVDRSKRTGRKSRCKACECAAKASWYAVEENRVAKLEACARRKYGPSGVRTCPRCAAPLPHGTLKRYCRACCKRRARTGTGWHGFTPEARNCAACGASFTAHAPHARFCSDACTYGSRGTARERGYDAEHFRLRARLKVAVDAGAATCARCGGPIVPGERWDLDHTDDRSAYLGPSHASCNRGKRPVNGSPGRTSRQW